MIIFDQEKCTGCGICAVVCSMKNEGVINPAKSRIQINTVKNKDGLRTFEANLCNQCGKCIKNCPEGAIYRTSNRVVKIDSKYCSGCNTCVEVCPTRSIFTHPEISVPLKCDVCGECVDMCPQGALTLKAIAGKEARS